VRAEVLDAQHIARIAADLVADVNPWSIHPLAITSIDFIKRPEVMRSLETLTWDVLVFDEAHALAGRSDRAAAAGALGCRARVGGHADCDTALRRRGGVRATGRRGRHRRRLSTNDIPANPDGCRVPRESSFLVLKVRPTTAETGDARCAARLSAAAH
jgi:hypothetical protein